MNGTNPWDGLDVARVVVDIAALRRHVTQRERRRRGIRIRYARQTVVVRRIERSIDARNDVRPTAAHAARQKSAGYSKNECGFSPQGKFWPFHRNLSLRIHQPSFERRKPPPPNCVRMNLLMRSAKNMQNSTTSVSCKSRATLANDCVIEPPPCPNAPFMPWMYSSKGAV